MTEPLTIRDLNESERATILTHRYVIERLLADQSKCLFEGDWVSACNLCHGLETASKRLRTCIKYCLQQVEMRNKS